ncbi:hypothetical protein [Streptomyces sp. WMMB 322]|uniref:hypothetical protein n=1 Tax=Streptomyces sp. WMMB 322 TaxID=1286821 RepID=UPI0006E45159|nr:hypothetical protein [Streptomyces sp. WMMB 322]SCK45876.1 hypothetical protein H180DRAFT_04062 [Streptomyces sp. WMMB 322]
MVQVDVFWAYGIGAGFGTAAAFHLRNSGATGPAGRSGPQRPSPWLLATALYCGMLFAPSGIWLLWSFPDWETMQVADGHGALPGWLVALFALTNVSQGLLGYEVARRLIVRGRVYAAFLQTGAGYLGMFLILVHGWDGRGYQRFFSPGREEFAEWPESHGPGELLSRAGDWAGSPVGLTLAGMGVVLLPVLFWLLVTAIRSGQREAGAPVNSASRIVGTFLLAVFGLALGSAVLTSVLVHQLGWWAGTPVAALVVWGLVLRRETGAAHRVFGLLGLPDAPKSRGPENREHPGGRARPAAEAPAAAPRDASDGAVTA